MTYCGLVEYILLSEFDIDLGSVLTVQYPNELPIPEGKSKDEFETLIANMMLPDGCQNLEWDHCNFILYRSNDKIENKNPLYGLNIVYRKLDSSVRRGAIVKALSILSPIPELNFTDGWATGLFPLLRTVLLDYFELNTTKNSNKDNIDISPIEHLFKSINECANGCSIQKVRKDAPFLSYSVRSLFQKRVCYYKTNQFRIHFPLSCHSNTFAVGSISNIIRLFGIKSVLELFRAIILEKNILFLAHNISASELCTQVIMSTLFVCPVIENLLCSRVFPYVSFNDLEFQSVQGFIAGTSNPFFKQSCNYDLLVDLNEGTISSKSDVSTKKTKKKKFGSRIKSSDIDYEFIKFLEIGMQQLALGETWIKRQFQTYTIKIADVASKYPETPAQFYEGLSYYINILKHCKWYSQYVSTESVENEKAISPCIRKLCYAMNGQYKDIGRSTILSCLLTLSNLPKDESTLINIIALLLKYFGSVDLTDAINRVTGTHDHENIEKFQCLNAALIKAFTDLFATDFQLLQF